MKGPRNVIELTPPSNEPATRDLPLAAFLASRGVRLVGTKLYGTRVFFVFRAEGFDEHRAAWFSGDDNISARAFADSLRTMKQLLHEVLDNRTGPEGA